MLSKYDFWYLVVKEDWIGVDSYMESMRKEEDLWSWYNEVLSDLEIDAFESCEEYSLDECIKNFVYMYIFD